MNTGPTEVELQSLARLLEGWGCPPQRSLEMARQLDRRADQLARQTGRSKPDAMAHLLRLFQQAASARQSPS
ncbi:MAG: hypothetical protein WHT82_11745 [Limisphaera sp.]